MFDHFAKEDNNFYQSGNLEKLKRILNPVNEIDVKKVVDFIKQSLELRGEENQVNSR